MREFSEGKPNRWLKWLYICTLFYVFICVGHGVYTRYAVKTETPVVATPVQRNCTQVIKNDAHLKLTNAVTQDDKVFETDTVKLTSYTDSAETHTAAEFVRNYLTERQKATACLENVIVYCEVLSNTACAGYYKYYTTTILGNAEYTVPAVTVVYAETTDAGLIKHIITTAGKTYNADVETALADFLYNLDIASFTAFDLLSVTDVTGTYIPHITFAYTAPEYFEFDSTTGTILEYRINDKGAPTAVYIPETIGGVTVRSIADKAFYKYKDTDIVVQSIVIPDTVTSIGAYAFAGCTALEQITLSKNLVSIGEYALSGCTALKTIDLPEQVRSLPAGCFYGDTALEYVNGMVTSYTATTFARCDNLTRLPTIIDVVQ